MVNKQQRMQDITERCSILYKPAHKRLIVIQDISSSLRELKSKIPGSYT